VDGTGIGVGVTDVGAGSSVVVAGASVVMVGEAAASMVGLTVDGVAGTASTVTVAVGGVG